MPGSRPVFNRIGRALIAIGLGVILVCSLLALARAARPARAAPVPPRLPSLPPTLQTTIGTTDSIQLAIDNASPGDTIVVTDTRVYTEVITIWKPITLTGASLSSTIVYSTGNAIIRVITDDVRITNLSLTGGTSKPAASGVRIEDAADITVSGLTINRLDYGVQVRGSNTSVNGITITNNIIVNNIITPSTDAGIYGIYFRAMGPPGAIQARVQNNQVSGFGSGFSGALIKADNLAPSLIADNVLTSTTVSLLEGAIDLNQAGTSLVQDNTFETSVAPALAVRIVGTANPTVTQNSIDPGFLTGILVGGAAQPLITDSLLSSLGTGISVIDTATPTVRNSQIIDNMNDGISLGADTAARLEGNLIQNNGSDGVFLNDSARLLEIAGNTICNNSQYGLSNSSNLAQLAASNWWGHNPPLDGDSTPPSDYTNLVTTTPEISMALTVQPVVVPINGSAAVNLAMHDGLISYTVRDNTPINFAADAGNLDPTATSTLNGLATATYTGTVLGTHVIAAIDSCGGLVTTTVTVVQPVLTTTKTADPLPGSEVSPGQLITYTVYVTNSGGYTATNVVFSDTVPSFTQLAFASVDTGTIATTNPISATFAPIAPGAAMSVTFGVTVTLPLTNGTLITNTGAISYFNGTSDVITTTNPVTHVVRSSPNLTITKTAQPPHGDVVRPGDFITYTLQISNTGDANATGLLVSDTLPAHTEYIVSSPNTQGSPPDLRWDSILPDLPAPTGTLTITFTVEVTRPLANGTIISNTAQVTATEFTTITTSNVVTHLVQSAANLTVTKTASPPHSSLVDPGQPITYTLHVTNTGSEMASSVVLTDDVPLYTDYAYATPSTGTITQTGGVITWTIGDLTVDVPVSATVGVTVTSPLTDGLIISNLGWVTHSGAGVITPSNTVTHQVTSASAVTYTKEADPPHGSSIALSLSPPTHITYTIWVTNDGNANATGLAISDMVPADTSGNPLFWSPGFLAGDGGAISNTLAVTVNVPLDDLTLITNTYAVSYDQAMGVFTSTSALSPTNVVTHLIRSAPDITVTKTASPPSGSPVTPGQVITYAFTVTNNGTANATQFVMSDTIPAHTSYITNSVQASAGAVVTQGLGITQVATPTLSAPGGVLTFSLAVRVDAPLTNGVLITDSGWYSFDQSTGITQTNLVTHQVQSAPEITLTKEAVPPHGAVITPGERITYTIFITNNGTADATDAVLTDIVPQYTSYVTGTASPTPTNFSPLIWNLGTIGGLGGVSTATFAVQVDVPLTNGLVITNTGWLNIAETVGISGTNPVTHLVQSAVDISFTKGAQPPSGSTVTPGDPITYTLVAVNTGTDVATGVVMTDTLPPEVNVFTYTVSKAPPPSLIPPRTVVWSPDTLTAGETITATIQVTVTTPLTRGTVITDVALLQTDQSGISTTNAVTHTVLSTPTLELRKVAEPPHGSAVRPGDLITYTLAATNSGNGPATNFLITDTVPATTTFAGWLGVTPGFNTGGPNPLTITGTLGAGQAMTGTFAATVSVLASDGDIISNTGYVSYSESTVISATNQVTHLVQAAPLITLTKEAAPPDGSSVHPGDPITYTVWISNNAVTDATGLVITDTLPAHTNLAPGSFTTTMGLITSFDPLVIDVGNLGGGSTMTFTFQVTVTTPLTDATVITNAARLRADSVGIIESNWVTHTVVATPLLSVIKENLPGYQVTPGAPLVYTLRIRNDGDGNATNVVITDMLPGVVNFWFDAVPPATTRTISGTTWALNIPSMSGGGTELSVPIVVTVTTPLTNGLVFTNVASYLSDQTPLTDSNVVTNVVVSEPVLVAAKSADPPDGSTVSPGDTITYTISVTNIGTENAPNLVITDTIPAYTNFVVGSEGISGGVNSSASFTPPDTVLGTADWLNVGEAITLTYAVTVTTPLTDGTIISNIALVASDRTAVDNTNLVTHVVQSQVALTYTKTAQPPPGPITPGDAITYTITLTNSGTADATGLVLTDTIPTYTNFITGSEGASGTALESGGVLTFTGNIPAAGGVFTATFGVTVTTPLTNGTPIVNVASFTTDQTSVVSQTNSVTHTVLSTPSLVISKSADPLSGSVVEPGDWITYTLTAVNSGTADASGVVFTDTLDPNLNFVDVAPAGGVTPPNPLIFDVGLLPGNGGVVSYTVRVTVATPLTSGTIITNSAHMTANEVPTATLSNEVTHTVVATPDLTILKWAAPPNGSSVDPGDSISYLIYVGNSGSGPATNLTITDTLPISTSYIGAWFNPITTTGVISGPDPLVATIPSLPSGSWVTFGFAVSVTNSAPPGLVITNVAQVDSDETVVTDTNVVTHVVRMPGLVITKTAVPAAGTIGLLPGSSITYTVTVTNNGGGTAHNVVISDALDPNVTLVTSATLPSVPIYGPNPVTATWASLASGDSASLVMSVVITNPLADGTIITNLASADSDETTLVATGPVTHQVGSFSILTLDKTADPPDGTSVSPGDTITYTISVDNIGFDAADGLVLTDTLSADVSYVPSSLSLTPGFSVLATPPPALVVSGTLPAGNALTATFQVTVSTVPSGTLLVNTAEVTATDTSLLTDTTTHPVGLPAPDLVITKSAVPASGTFVEPGDWITYTVTAVNNGGPASNVVISDTLDLVNVTLVTSQATTGTLGGPNPVTLTGFDLDSGDAVTMTLGVTVTGNVSGTLITNQASITSTQSTSLRVSNPVTHVISSTIPAPDLVITKSAIPASGTFVEPGDWITYTVTAVNNGGPASNVIISDTLDLVNVTLVTSNTISGTLGGPNPVTLTGFDLGSGDMVTMTLGVTVTGNVSGTLITNQASISSTQSTALRVSNPVTHVISSTGAISPSFTVIKTADPPDGTPVTQGDTITYTITVANTGGWATGVVISDVIPAGTAYAGNPYTSLGGISFDGTQVTVSGVPSFPPGSVLQARFQVTVTTNLSTTITNTAVLVSNETAPQTSNPVSHPVQGTGASATTIYLPIIFKNFAGLSASLSWVGKTTDRVSLQDGALGLVGDTLPDGAFWLVVNLGSTGSKRATSVRLISSQPGVVEWDTPMNMLPVLGVFDGNTLLNEPDGTINRVINGGASVTLYASDEGDTRFPPDTYDYTVIVSFQDGTSLSASTRIPPTVSSLPPPPPPPPSSSCAPELLGTVTVGNTPRGIALDPTRNRVYVANNGDSSLSVIDSSSNTVIETIAGVTSANGVAYDPTHNMIWVTNNLGDRVTPIQANASATSFTPLAPIKVGDEPWGVAYDPIHDYVYVANRSGPSVTVINATALTVTTTLMGSFSQPSHVAVNPVTGKAYVTNFGDHSVTVLDGASVSSVVDLNVSDPSTQPYGVAVDEIRNLVYVATVDSHRVVVIGTLMGTPDRLLGWSAFHRGFGDPARPVPMRVIAVNPNLGPAGDGGHVWTTTSTSYGSEANQALLIPKGWGGYFGYPLPHNVGADPSEGIAVDRTTNRVYVSSGTSPGTVTVLGDDTDTCLIPFVADDGIGFEVFTVE